MNGWNKIATPVLGGAFAILLAATVVGVWDSRADIASIKATLAPLATMIQDHEQRLRMVEIMGGK